MNWLTNLIRPRIRSLVGEQKDVPENLWQKCESCEGMLFHSELSANHFVCYHCGHHLPIKAEDRLKLVFDEGKYERISLPNVEHDPLKFKDRKKYADRLKEYQNKIKEKDAIIVAKGKIGGQNAVIAAFNFAFMGGSMGTAVGEGIVKAAETAVKNKAALIAIPASGGARMQEGALSLMQMPRTTIAVNMVKKAGLPYFVLLTNPTTGGVTASFAMLGDIHIAEPGSTIGFAGRRVIEETVRETLPDDFQTAEYLLEHGMVDMVVQRKELNAEIGKLLGLLMDKKQKPKEKKKNNGKNGNGKKGDKIKSVDARKSAGTVAKVTQAEKAVTKEPANASRTAEEKRKKAGL